MRFRWRTSPARRDGPSRSLRDTRTRSGRASLRSRFDKLTRPSSVQLDPAAARLLRLGALLQLVQRAVALQDEADEVILACAQPGETPGSVARRGRRVAAEYARLQGWALDLCEGDEAWSLPRRVGELLSYHTEMLDMSLKLAFPRYYSAKLEHRRRALTGLGEPARTLRDTETALRMWIDELGCAS